MSNKVPIKELNTDIFLNDPFRCIIFGSTKAGKTHFVENVIYPVIKKRFAEIYVFCQDYNVARFKENLELATHQKKVLTEKNEELLIPNVVSSIDEIVPSIEMIRERQVKNIYPEEKTENFANVYRNEILLIFDDILDEKFIKDDVFINMFATFRNLDISVIFLIQTATVVVSRLMKNNTNIFILCEMFYIDIRNNILHSIIAPALASYLHDEQIKYDERSIYRLTEKLYDTFVSKIKYGKLIVETNEKLLYYWKPNLK